MATTVPPRADILVKRTGELAFEAGEDAACLILEMGTIVHGGRDAVEPDVELFSPRGQLG